MSELKKTVLNLSLMAVAMLSITFLWVSPYILLLPLSVVTILMLAIERHRSAVYIFIFAFVVGPVSEVFSLPYGAWIYANPQVFGVPVWLPFMWGIVALFLNRLSIYVHTRTN